eukprot:Colp12_sorted_trinity150504_noHs@25654
MVNFMVPFDFSQGAVAAVQYTAASVVIEKDRDLIYVIHIMDPNTPDDEFLLKKEEVLAKLEESVVSLKQHGIHYKLLVERGDPREVICDFASILDVNAIIMGARGLNTIQKLWLGSVSDYVVRNAPCHVIIAKSLFSAEIKS